MTKKKIQATIDMKKLDEQIKFYKETGNDPVLGYTTIAYHILSVLRMCLSPRVKSKRGIERKQ